MSPDQTQQQPQQRPTISLEGLRAYYTEFGDLTHTNHELRFQLSSLAAAHQQLTAEAAEKDARIEELETENATLKAAADTAKDAAAVAAVAEQIVADAQNGAGEVMQALERRRARATGG